MRLSPSAELYDGTAIPVHGDDHVLEIVVHKVRGRCPVYAEVDRIVINGPHVVPSKTDALCTHALATLLHYTTILEHEWCPVQLGLSTPDDPHHAYMQCVDPGPPYTDGGTVIFRCQRIADRNVDEQM